MYTMSTGHINYNSFLFIKPPEMEKYIYNGSKGTIHTVE